MENELCLICQKISSEIEELLSVSFFFFLPFFFLSGGFSFCSSGHLPSSCLSLQRAVITDVSHHTWLKEPVLLQLCSCNGTFLRPSVGNFLCCKKERHSKGRRKKNTKECLISQEDNLLLFIICSNYLPKRGRVNSSTFQKTRAAAEYFYQTGSTLFTVKSR